MEYNHDKLNGLTSNLLRLLYSVIALFILLFVYVCLQLPGHPNVASPLAAAELKTPLWRAPDLKSLGSSPEDEMIKYGRELIANTSLYFGPNGKLAHTSNGMNCQNCHLDAGTKPFGNNYSAVAANYPKFRERSGKIESIYKRVNDCFERSLNGKAIDTLGKEMKAIEAYIVWLGQAVKRGEKPKGAGLTELAYMDRAADPDRGKQVYIQKCQSCHSENGGGKLNPGQQNFQYPPLWGAQSYNIGAGLFRLSRLAGYVKSNMPFGSSYDQPQLGDEEAWDVAAFVNSQPRPYKDLRADWPRLAGKPVDHPFGPYTDSLSEKQHKFGPFTVIAFLKKDKKI